MSCNVTWIKIVTDIFKNRKIKQIEKLPEADTILIIWVKTLCLAGELNSNGLLLLTKDVPYNLEMLANEYGRELSTVRMAFEIFEKFNMLKLVGSVYVICNWEKYQNIEGLDKIREQTRKRVAKYREKQKKLALPEKSNVTSNDTLTYDNAIEKEIEIDKEIYIFLLNKYTRKNRKDFKEYLTNIKNMKNESYWSQLSEEEQQRLMTSI